MNDIRRKRLNEISARIEELREELQGVCDEEEECKDNMPESLQCTERYEKMEESVDAMEEIISNLDDAISSIEDIVS